MTCVVVTMAGESRRFREAGISEPKYRLTVRGRTLFSWALDSLRWYMEAGAGLVLVGRADDAGLDRFVAAECALLGFPAPALVRIEGTTSGQAETVLAAAEHVRAEDRLVVYNIDTHVRPGALDGRTLEGDGAIPCFPGAGDGWSFVAADADGRVTDVREKQRISAHASVGLYAFRSLELYRAAYEATPSVRGERYVAPMYRELIARGCEIRLVRLAVDDVVPLGTPEQVAEVA